MKIKTIFILISIFVLTFVFVGFGVAKSEAEEDLLVSSNNTGVTGNELLVLLLKIKSISLDGELFNDPIFEGLKDFSKEIAPQPVGRNNPFAPLGSSTISNE